MLASASAAIGRVSFCSLMMLMATRAPSPAVMIVWTLAPAQTPAAQTPGLTRPSVGVHRDDLGDARLRAGPDLQPRSARQVEVCAERQQHRPRFDGLAVAGCQREPAVACFQGGDVGLDPGGAGNLGLPLPQVHQIWPGDAIGESEVVVEHGAPRHALIGVDDHGL